jgi:peptide/nickel transport system permease protein
MIPRMLLDRVAGSAFVLLTVAVVVYWGTVILPGDALTASLPMDILATMSTEELDRRRAELGLDRPHLVQFLEWIGRMVTLDFGRTLVTKEPVLDRIAHPILNSIILAGIAALVAPLVAVALAVASVIRPHGRADAALSGTTLVAYSLPEFVTGNVLIVVFAVLIPVAPAVILLPTSAGTAEILGVVALPIATLVIGGVAYQYRLLRAALIETLETDFVERARLSGEPEWRVILVHALPTALVPMLSATAQFVSALISGGIVIEFIFGFPGIGVEMVQGIANREIPTVQAIAMLGATAVVVCNLAADVLVLALDPRVRRRSHV